jgi:hypothetical protein
MPSPAIAAGVAIGSAVLGTIGGISANKKAEKAAERQAKFTYKTRMEEISRLRGDARGVIGENRARAYASGLMETGTTKNFIDNVRADFARDISWRSGAAKLERRSIRKGGQISNVGTIASGIGQIGGTLMNYYS